MVDRKIDSFRSLAYAVRDDYREAVVGWQPIETAPKDGRDLLLWTTSAGDKDLTEYLAAFGDDEEVFARVQIGNWDGSEWYLHLVGNPTHWQPLPAPPSTKGAGG